ncbi:ABC transporter ATP-binding protein [Euzebya tangerina]|uniref:ABC transporter ATP-binding protein n=1 Tax=Euzebya tangerina TaxID=591198 RepID=UPI000E315AE0|nr:ABC transporter ATP-binding protein [Euzebya tangerina]
MDGPSTAEGTNAEASLLAVRDLRSEFHTTRGTVHAVNGVSFDVDRGELVGIVGESGCGKSATIRSIIGLLRPPGRVVGGSADFLGRDLVAMSARRRRQLLGARIGFVPQNPFGSLNPVMTIERQFLRVIREHSDLSKADARDRARTMLDRAGIADPERVLGGYAHQLSGGMAQRTVLAIAMSLEPDLVIADEPTTGLDVTVQRQILDLTIELVQRDERAMLLVTHDLGVVAHYCQRVVVMYAGKVVEVGPTAAVFAQPAHPYTELLLQAVPRPGEPLRIARGQIPDLVDYPEGCPFYDRCEYRDDPRCQTQAPPLREVGPDHQAAVYYDISARQPVGTA